MDVLFPDLAHTLPEGFALFRGRLSRDEQRAMLDAVANVIAEAPLFRPQMPTGPYMINSLTNCGALGWVSDKRGYRYQETHPETHSSPIKYLIVLCITLPKLMAAAGPPCSTQARLKRYF